jgi:pimeloyl-ACP methyl ester carboxylesterase
VVALVVVVVLLAVLLGAAGWYYAGQIDSDGLAADPAAAASRPDVTVTAVAGGRVSLRPLAGHTAGDALTTGDVYGLTWAGGAGVLSGPPQAGTDGATSRALQVVQGTAPQPGTAAASTRDVWTDPTAAYGVGYSDVSYPCAGGNCPAWFVPGTSATTWLVAVHGKGAGRTEPLRALGPAVRAGMPVLDIAYRNDAGAPPDPSHRYGYGSTEWRDLEAAVQYARAHGAQQVVLFGSSMGGSIVASFLEHSASASAVRGIVLDAPALDFRATVDHGAAQRSLPLGLPIPGVLTSVAEWIAGWRYDVDWAALDYLPGDWLHVPALLFHGTEDGTVPLSTSDAFRAAHPSLVQEVRVTGADHVESWNVDPAGYTARETAFLGCVTGPAPATTCAG